MYVDLWSVAVWIVKFEELSYMFILDQKDLFDRTGGTP